MSLRLALRNIQAHWIRSLLTVGSVTLAVTLLCVLVAIVSSLKATVDASSTNRLWVQSAVSLYVDLPLSYREKIAKVPGIDLVMRFQWFGAVYQDPSNFFSQFGVDPELFLECYPEAEIVEGSYEEFARTRNGCVVGQSLADEYGWAVGDTVPLIGTIFSRPDGSPWEFIVKAIYRRTQPSLDPKMLIFNFQYLQESLEGGVAEGPQGAGTYLLRIRDDKEATRIMADVDTLFENGPQVVQTTTEAEFSRQFISMLGNVPMLLSGIGGAVLFALFFAVLNTMLMAGRERARDVGVMKALGFGSGSIFAGMITEAIVLCGAGGLLGVGAAKGLEGPLIDGLGAQINGLQVTGSTLALGLALSLGLGLMTGFVPARWASRLNPVDALRRGG